MPNIGKHLVQLTKDQGHFAVREQFTESLATGKIKAREVSVRELAESYMGPGWFGKLRAYNMGQKMPITVTGVREGEGKRSAVSEKRAAPFSVGHAVASTQGIMKNRIQIRPQHGIADLDRRLGRYESEAGHIDDRGRGTHRREFDQQQLHHHQDPYGGPRRIFQARSGEIEKI